MRVSAPAFEISAPVEIGLLLQHLIRHRADWDAMLSAILRTTAPFPPMAVYVREWAKGHFLPGYR